MKKMLNFLTMVIVWASAHAQSPQWLPFDSGTIFTNNLYSFTYGDDLYVSEEITGYLYKSVSGVWEPVVSPGFGIRVSKDFKNQWWVVGDSSVAVFNESEWTVVKTVHGQILTAEIGNDNNLYIGGSYETDDGITNIMKTDGTNFLPLDTNQSIGQVLAIVVSPFTGNLQFCQGIDAPPTSHIIEWDGVSYQIPNNEGTISIFGVGEAVVLDSMIYYFMYSYDPEFPESGMGIHLITFDGTNWKSIAEIDGDIDVLYPDSLGLVFSCFGSAWMYHDSISTHLSGVYRLNSDSTVTQIGTTLYGYINTISKNADDQFVVAGYFGEIEGAPIYPNVLVLTNADTTTGGTDAIEIENLSGFTLFPNPTNGFITISGLPSQKTDIDIYDVTGRRVEHYGATQKATLNVSDLPTGMYVIRTPVGESRFIKQ